MAPVTVLEGIQKSAAFLARKGVESPRLQAELLLAHVLNVPRMQLYLNFERILTAAETDKLRTLIQRRGRREPAQHIVGSTSFCGLEIAVNRQVLVPRPETELLAESGSNFLNQLSTLNPPAAPGQLATSKCNAGGFEGGQPATALDFGTGSGCIAITLAVRCPGARVFAIDISAEALEVAKSNAASHRVDDRIKFFQGDGFAALPHAFRFDLIVSNPPYVPSAEIESLQPEVCDYDPRAALDGGLDGLDFFRRLAAEAQPFLKPQGRIMLELGDGQAPAVTTIFEKQNWIVQAVKEDYTRRPRFLIVQLAPGFLATDEHRSKQQDANFAN